MQFFTYYLKEVVGVFGKVRSKDFLSLGLTRSFSPSERSFKKIMDFAKEYSIEYSSKTKDLGNTN